MNTPPFAPKQLFTALFIFMGSAAFSFIGHPIGDYYQKHKNDRGMEAKMLPPKTASLFVDEDYPEAIDILQSMSTLKYLNFYGKKNEISSYAKNAISAKGSFDNIFSDVDGNRKVAVFGEKKRGKVRKVIAVVQTKTQFLLIIGRGKLSNQQIAYFPDLSKEIQ